MRIGKPASRPPGALGQAPIESSFGAEDEVGAPEGSGGGGFDEWLLELFFGPNWLPFDLVRWHFCGRTRLRSPRKKQRVRRS